MNSTPTREVLQQTRDALHALYEESKWTVSLGCKSMRNVEPILARLDAYLSEPACSGDPGECTFNGACMYACGKSEPDALPASAEDQKVYDKIADRYFVDADALQAAAQPVSDEAKKMVDELEEAIVRDLSFNCPALVENARTALYQEIDRLAATPPAEERSPEVQPHVQQTLVDRLCLIFNIGTDARTVETILTNVENALRRADCLSAVERAFFTVTKIEEGEEVEECDLNWGSSPADYVEQMRAAIAELYGSAGERSTPAETTFKAAVVIWMEARERCQHYHGIKDDEDSVQCSHPHQRTDWCGFGSCPMLNEEADRHGVA